MTDPIFSLMEMLSPKENTFQDVGYFVSGKVHPKLIEMLDVGGARQKSYPTIGVTHFIAGENADRDQMDEAKDIFDIPIVSPRWIMYSTHQGKILPASWFLSEGKELFSGLTFTASGLREKDLTTAWALVTFHNGTFLRHLTKECTHLITNETSSRKYTVAKQLNLPIVCVDWITDSIKNGSRLNEKLYDPRLLRSSSSPQPTSSPLPPPPFCTQPPASSQPSTMLNSLEKSLGQTNLLEPKEIPDWIREGAKQKRNHNYVQPLPLPTSYLNGMDRTAPSQIQSDQSPVKTTPSPVLSKDEYGHLQPSVIRRPSGCSSGELKLNDNPPSAHEEPPPPPTPPQRPAASAEQLEIIQMIQNDPQIKLQWAHMDHTQRMLLVQKLAQKNREERLRKEMMLKQQQLQMNHAPPLQTSTGQDVLPSSSSRPHQNNANLLFQNHDLRPRFPLQMVRQGDPFTLQTRQPQPMLVDDDGQQVFGHPDTPGPSTDGQSPQQQTVFFTRGAMQDQRQILVTQHQSGATIRSDQHLSQSFSPPNDSSMQRILTPQVSQTSNQKVQAYLQNNVMSMQQLQQDQQQQQMVVSGGSQFYGQPSSTTATTNQQQHDANVRRVSVGQQPQQQVIVDPQSSPQGGQGQRDHFQWSPTSTSSSPGSFNSLSNSPQAQQRLISPTGGMTSRQNRPPSDPQQQQQQQQWSTAMRNQSPQLIYTTQANMPYASQVMNQKTKTALANLLSTRLLSSTPEGQVSYSMSCGLTGGTTAPSRSPSPLAPPPPPPPTTSLNVAIQNRVPPAGLSGKQQPTHSLQRRTLSNLTNSDKGPGPMNTNNSMVPVVPTPQSPTSSYSSQSARFFGHDPSLKLPAGGFLLGCVFWAAQEPRLSNWYKCVLKYGGEIEPGYSNRVTHVLCETQKFPEFQQCVRERKRLVTLFWLNDTIGRRCLASPSQAVHLPLPFSENERPYFGEMVSTSGFSLEEKERVYAMCSLLGLTVTSIFTRSNIGLIAKTPEGEKFLKAREWRKPVVNIQFLNELLFGHTGVIPMIHSPKYQQFNMGAPFSFDVALVAPLMASWKTPLRVSPEVIQKFINRPIPTVTSPLERCPAAKRLKLELDEILPPPSSPRSSIEPIPSTSKDGVTGVAVMFTGFSSPMEIMKSKVEDLGGRVTDDRYAATHLIVHENIVTKALITYLCIKDTIVGIDWLRYSCAAQKFLAVDDYRITTGVCGIYQINYSAIFKLPNRNRLFSGLVFFITPTVGRDVNEIIEAAGGKIVVEKSMTKVYESAMKNLESYIVVTCEDDEYLLTGWKGKDSVENIIVVTRDAILGWILKQDIRKEEDSKSGTIQTNSTSCGPTPSTSTNSDEFPTVLDGLGGDDIETMKLNQVTMEMELA